MEEEEDWELWFAMARDSLVAAKLLEIEGNLRSAASRFYYAAYQAVTATLLYRGLNPPVIDGEPREAWSHADTPDIFVDQLIPIVRNRDRRNDVARRLRDLYRLRVDADYSAHTAIEAQLVATARRNAGFIVKIVEEMLE